ncbi:Dsba oxidoreductase [Pseudomonas sp. 8Z]|uniref:DsbA family protein n=1 Tax=Pseudomonas sp. 8Z TaxID=2653166 RepID=UPI0012F047BF|nr:thioredoxin domain-containing protein [Pseudomonas sp. 8Z]VXC22991.1 Dsba oxidoreductase [Pseudomonas sp. 8Z]
MKLPAQVLPIGLVLAMATLVMLEGQTRHHDGPWLYGAHEARWTITEFADLECPYCKSYTPELKQWVSTQKNVALQWHHLPLPFHGTAAIHEARLVECAGKLRGGTAFWQAIDQVLERTLSNGQGFTAPLDLENISHEDLERCASEDVGVALRIDQQVEEAKRLGFSGTPSLLIVDNLTGHSIKLEGPVDGATLLSSIDWLAQPPYPTSTENP